MTKRLLSRDQIVAALEAVGAKLAARGTSTQLVLVGGAVMSLQHGVRSATRDVDVLAIQGAEAETMKAAEEVATDLALEPNWLNQDVRKVYTNPEVSDGPEILSAPGVSVRSVSLMQMLAMKLCAFRDDLDIADARHLLTLVPAHVDLETAWVALEAFLIRGKQRAARENLEDLWEQNRGPT